MPRPTDARVFRSILCPVDFSADSRAALRYAAALARRSDSHLVVVYVKDPLLAIAAATRSDARALIQASEDDLRRFVTGVTAAEPIPVTSSRSLASPPEKL
jgi:nucleotide-binding universal stress UspA family protein